MTRSRTFGALIALLAMAWLMVAPPPSSDAFASTAVRIKAAYVDEAGTRHDLVGVEVWLLENYGLRRFECTNANGVAFFDNVSSGVLHTVGMGPSYSNPRCANSEFTNPVDGRFMWAVVYNKNYGVLPLPEIVDGFYPPTGETTKIPLITRDAKRQKKVCSGLQVTEVLTNGDDVWTGTNDADIVNALGGNDLLDGLGGADYLCGGKGNDELIGNGQGDVLLGQDHKDVLSGNKGFDILDGGAGTKDWCRGELLFDCER